MLLNEIYKIIEKRYSLTEIIQLDNTFIAGVYQSLPIVVSKAKGVFLWDVEGKKYLDFTANYSACNIGYGNDEMIEILREQLNFSFICPWYINEYRIKLAEILLKITSKEFSKCWFGVSGSDAVEAAIKFAKICKRRYKIISLWNGYHGSTLGALSAHGLWNDRIDLEPLLPGFIHTPSPYCYRCDFNLEYPTCGLTCLDFLKKTIKREGDSHIAAVILEPVLAGGGVIVPPDEYLKELRNLCDDFDILLILDEVVTGFGRTGKLFCYQHHDIVPDLLVLGKGFTSGYVPGSAVLLREEVGNIISEKRMIRHTHTHATNPLTCIAAMKNIEIIIRNDLPANALIVGEYFLRKLKELVNLYEICGDVRGKGLLLGLEIVSNKKEKKPRHDLVQFIIKKCVDRGLLIEPSNGPENSVIVFHPPLIITKEHVDLAIIILEDIIREVNKELKK
ncbi:MAG: aspartate aminotransferase family protein [Nitrososphaerales archaeon]